MIISNLCIPNSVARLTASSAATWAAYGEFSEHRRGKIFPGFDADLTILSQDITICSPDDILNIDILGTIVNGNIIHNKL